MSGLLNVMKNKKKINTYMKHLRDFILESTEKTSPTDMEILICFAHNREFFEGEDEKNLTYCVTQKYYKQYEYIISKYYDGNDGDYNIYDKMVKPLKDNKIGKLHKLYDRDNITSKWKEASLEENNTMSANKSLNNTPKTDIIDEKGRVRITVKEGFGKKSQLCSSMFNEAKAMLLTCATSDEIRKKLNDLFDLKDLLTPKRNIDISGLRGATKDEKLKMEVDSVKEEIDKYIKPLLSDLFSDEEYAKSVIHEAITGENKYGGGKACPNSVFLWSYKGDGDFYSSIDEFMDTCGTPKVILKQVNTTKELENDTQNVGRGITIDFRYKSNHSNRKLGTYTIYPALRIDIKDVM
jgi:hypothetical protein